MLAKKERLLDMVQPPNSLAESYLSSTSVEQEVADKQAADKTRPYQKLETTHIFFPVAIETACSWVIKP